MVVYIRPSARDLVSFIMNALIVSLCYRGKAHHIKNEGTLKDIQIMSDILVEKFKFKPDDIKVLREEQATLENFSRELQDMANSNAKINFIYFVGHGFSCENRTKENDPEARDSGFLFYDRHLIDDDMCELLKKFRKDTKNLLMFAQCYSGNSADLKFHLREDAVSQALKRKREVKSKTVLISAVSHEQVSWCFEDGSAFAKNFRNVIREHDEIKFFDLMRILRQLDKRQKCSISSSFKLDEDDHLFRKRSFSWINTQWKKSK